MVGNKEELMASGADSFLTKKEANVKDAGIYRCKMVDTSGYTSSQLDFQVVGEWSESGLEHVPRSFILGFGLEDLFPQGAAFQLRSLAFEPRKHRRLANTNIWEARKMLFLAPCTILQAGTILVIVWKALLQIEQEWHMLVEWHEVASLGRPHLSFAGYSCQQL